MIEVRELVKRFGGFAALDGASVTVPEGSVYGLVGPNGAGKSTLIRHITGVYRADRGQVLVDGENVYENPEKKALVAAIPDEWFYFPSATIRDMMRFYRGFYPAFDMDRYERFKEVFAISEKAVIRRLSKGMQKQAAFWLTMCCRPKYLVLDEPVDGLDPVMRRQVWSLMMSDVAEYGTTVLVSSHNLRELEDLCDHVGIMERGKMIMECSLSQLQRSTVKVQLVGQPPAGLEILNKTASGRLQTLVVRGSAQEITARLQEANLTYFDVLPLTLEEIFIYELGGMDYEIQNILL